MVSSLSFSSYSLVSSSSLLIVSQLLMTTSTNSDLSTMLTAFENSKSGQTDKPATAQDRTSLKNCARHGRKRIVESCNREKIASSERNKVIKKLQDNCDVQRQRGHLPRLKSSMSRLLERKIAKSISIRAQ
jgi:hypothetical protein